MAKLTLVGKDGSREIDVSPRPVLSSDIETDSDIARRHSFALVRSLTPKLQKSGITETALWSYVLSSFEVSSRKDLTSYDWVRLAARLSAAAKDSTLLGVLVDEIKTCVGLCRVVRVHSDGTLREVYEGVITDDIEARCQSHADKSGCVVRLEGCDGADGILFFEPAEYAPDPHCPPVASPNPNKPARVYEIHRSGNETTYVEIPFPDTSDLSGWGQRHANACGYDVHITCRLGQNVLHRFEPQLEVCEGVNEVSIDGVVWILLNQWDDKWHWVKLDRSIQRHIATAENRTEAVACLVEYIKTQR